jgi:hypothetical protein
MDNERPLDGREPGVRWTLGGHGIDVSASINAAIFFLHVRPVRRQSWRMHDRISLQSKLLDAANAQLDRRRWRKLTKREIDKMFDPCRWREPVYAWLWANFLKVCRASTPRNGWNGLRWDEIAKIMKMDGVVGSRGDPPNANSVRRIWDRVWRDKEREAKAEEKTD